MGDNDYRIKRTQEKNLRDVCGDFRSLLLTGSRQVGKSTLLKHLAEPDRGIINFDDEVFRNEATDDPSLFFLNHKPPLLLDEVHRVPDIFLSIKSIIDESGKKNLFWLTGSQKLKLMKKAGDSLAGRVLIAEMYGLSISEKQGIPDRKPFLPEFNEARKALLSPEDVFMTAFVGSYPEIQDMSERSRAAWYESYIRTYFENDISEYINPSNFSVFRKFLSIIALRTGEELNYADIASSAGVSAVTVQAWISILEAFGILYILHPYYSNKLKSLVKRGKLYFMDTGLCSYLSGLHTFEDFRSSKHLGHIIETFAITEIIKSYSNNLIHREMYFYRDYNGREIDLLIEDKGILYPIEVKMSMTPKKDMVKHFSVLSPEERGMGAIVSLYPNKALLSKDVVLVPMSEI